MRDRLIRRVWFAGLWLLLPWPLLVFGDAFVPAVRYAILMLVVGTVGVAEGASGPGWMMFGLFAVMAALTTLGCWLLAWGIEALLSQLAPSTRRTVTWICLAAALLVSLWFDPYHTPFGRAPDGGLLDILS